MAARDVTRPPDPATTLAAAARGLVEELSRALEAAAGRPVKAGAPEVASLSAAEIESRLAGTSAAFCVDFGGTLSGRAAVVIPGALAPGLAGLLAGLSEENLAGRAKRAVSDEDLEALAGPLAGALPGMAEKLAAYLGEAPELALGDALLVKPGAAGGLLKPIGRGPYPAAAFQLEVEGLAGGVALVLFPRTFGAAPSTDVTAPMLGASEAAAGAEHLSGLHPNIQRILRLKLQVSVVLAEKQMDLESVLKLNPGTIIEFDKSADENLDLTVRGRKIGSGEVVIIGERFGIQLRHIEGLEQRIRRMGAAR